MRRVFHGENSKKTNIDATKTSILPWMHFLLVAFPSAVTLRKIYKVMDICGYLASSSADWLVFSPSFAFWSTYLFQGRVRHTKAAEAHVQQRLLQLPEEAGVRSGLEVTAGEQIGQLLTDGLHQASLGHVMMNQSWDALQVAWKWEEGAPLFLHPSLLLCRLWLLNAFII